MHIYTCIYVRQKGEGGETANISYILPKCRSLGVGIRYCMPTRIYLNPSMNGRKGKFRLRFWHLHESEVLRHRLTGQRLTGLPPDLNPPMYTLQRSPKQQATS